MSWYSRLRNLLRKEELDEELNEELRFHAERRAADLGITVEAARRRVGNTLRIREASRDIRIAVWLETVLQDVRLALRVWRKRPLVACTAILTLALGAGMNLAVFGLMWDSMWKPLPYKDADSLVQIWLDDPADHRTAPRNIVVDQWRQRSRSVVSVASYRPWRFTFSGDGRAPEQVVAALISESFFSTLGVRLMMGSEFTKSQVHAGGDNVVLLSESFWRRRFGGAPMVGRQVVVEGTLSTVVGIVSASFHGAALIRGARGAEPEAFLPLSRGRAGFSNDVSIPTSFAMGRLGPSVSVPVAEKELNAIARPEERRTVWLSPLADEVSYGARPAMLALIAATACILLIACANLANLLLAQTVTRRRELSLRAALGAGRARVIRQLVTEAMLLSMAGVTAGLLAARVFTGVIIRLYPGVMPRLEEGESSRWVVYLFAFGVSVASGLFFGLLPAWRGANEAGGDGLRVGNLLMSGGSRRWANALVGAQVGLTAVVLIGAGLMLKSFLALRSVDLGIAREHRVTATVDLPSNRYKTDADKTRFGSQLLERLRSVPGVSAAGISNSLPLRYTNLMNLRLRLPGVNGNQPIAGRAVGGDYFQAMGIRLMAGRTFEERSKTEVVVNETFVRRYLRGNNAIGLALPQDGWSLVVSGVAKDVRHLSMRDSAVPEIFFPFTMFPLSTVDMVVQSNLPPTQIMAAMRREMRAIDDQVPLGRPMPIEQVVDGELAQPRFQAVLLGVFAVVAMVLAAIGTYGVIAYYVRSRVPELGLRRALGAGAGDLIWLVLREGMSAPLIGLLLGVATGALVLGRFVESLLFGITPRDPAVFLLTAGVLMVTSLLACVLPSHAAVRIEPGVALRES